MKTVELFSGTKSFSKVAAERGHETFTVDFNEALNPDLVADLRNPFKYPMIFSKIQEADFVWMSPPCTTFSMSAGNTHWTANRMPKTQAACDGYMMLNFAISVATFCNKAGIPYVIENPRARARWFVPEILSRYTVWYCQYGDIRAKPTDIWTNITKWVPKTCKNGNPNCHHERAPRGSKTGTQGMAQRERGVVPHKLIEDLLEGVE